MSRCKFDVKRSITLTAFEIASIRWGCGCAFVIHKVFSIFLKWSVDHVLNQQYRVTKSVFKNCFDLYIDGVNDDNDDYYGNEDEKFIDINHSNHIIMMNSHHYIVSVTSPLFNCTFSPTHTIRCISYYQIYTESKMIIDNRGITDSTHKNHLKISYNVSCLNHMFFQL